MNNRTGIREAITDFLKGKTSAEDRVFEGRYDPLDRHEMPCVFVYDGSEPVTKTSQQGVARRSLQVTIEGRDFGGALDVDVKLDALGNEIESAMKSAKRLGGLIQTASITGSDKQVSGESSADIGAIRVDYEVLYFSD